MAARTARRTASTARRCPSTRGSPRRAAPRPLPSMMMATWRGAGGRGAPPAGAGAESSGFDIGARRSGLKPVSLDLHDFFFFDVKQRVDLPDRLVRCLLDVLLLTPLVVFADRAVLLKLLQQVDAVAPDVADRDARLLGVFVRDLDHLLAALLVHLGDAQPDCLALGQGVEAEVGVADGLLDRMDHAPVPDLDAEEPRLGHAHRGDLRDRHGGPVGVHLDRIEERGRRPPGAQAVEVVLQGADSPLHAALEIAEIEGCDGHYPEILDATLNRAGPPAWGGPEDQESGLRSRTAVIKGQRGQRRLGSGRHLKPARRSGVLG